MRQAKRLPGLARVCIGFMMASVTLVSSAGAQAPRPQDRQHDFQPTRLLPPQPAIVHPPMISAQDVRGQVTDNELVLGVEVNGEARAYPINMLNGPSREIINDTLGGVEIVAMWCHLCHSGIVFDRTINQQTLTFTVSGMLWRRTLVMMDLETQSLWSLLLTQAMAGPLQGQRLAAVPSKLTTWNAWRTEHPQTTLLNLSRTSGDFVRAYYQSPERFVYGLVIKGQPYHVSLAVLQRNPVLNLELGGEQLVVTFDAERAAANLFSRKLGQQTLIFTAAADGTMLDQQTETRWDRSSGQGRQGQLGDQSLQQQVGFLAFAQSWMAFYPASREVQP